MLRLLQSIFFSDLDKANTTGIEGEDPVLLMYGMLGKCQKI